MLFLLVGCGLSAREATEALRVHEAIVSAVNVHLTEVESIAGARHGSDGDYVYDGTLEDLPELDGGAVHVTGTGIQRGGGTHYEDWLEVVYEGVALDHVRMSGGGEVEVLIAVSDGVVSVRHAADVTVTTSGRISGPAHMDYVFAISGATPATWTGVVNDYDAAEISP